jgi:hypothetical protein
MNNFLENFSNSNSPNYLKKNQNTDIESKITLHFLNEMKNNNINTINDINKINNYIYFSNDLNKIINNNQQNYRYFVESKSINQLSQKRKEKNIQNKNTKMNHINKIKKKASFDLSKENKIIKSQIIIEEKNKKNCTKSLSRKKINRNTIDSFSEVKNFKTELCHNWELTGICKYGQNVNNYIFKIL